MHKIAIKECIKKITISRQPTGKLLKMLPFNTKFPMKGALNLLKQSNNDQ